MHFYKYQALGNDYVVIDPSEYPVLLKQQVQKICNRHYGVGADGVLYGPLYKASDVPEVRIYNADGSIAEISGNGLRIFAQYLKDQNFFQKNFFSLKSSDTRIVKGYFMNNGNIVMEWGQVRFKGSDKTVTVGGMQITYTGVDVGNPHCVILDDLQDHTLCKQIGAQIENHSDFEHGTNVQFLKVVDRKNIEIIIWERGSGYTLASGSSSIAAAAVAFKKGMCDSHITVHMPGGELQVIFDETFQAILIGEAKKVFEGTI